MNWVDWMIVIFLVTGIINGFRQGFVRLVVGLISAVLAFLLAAWFHGMLAGVLRDFIANALAATLLAYVLIFLGVHLLGWLVATVIVRIFKLIGLSPLDRLLGAGFGVVRACVVLIVAAMLMMAFLPNQLPGAVRQSRLAPWVVGASRIASMATPYDIRHGVDETYAQLRRQIDQFRSMRRPQIREE